MLKSQIYQTAMVAVIESKFDPYIKIDILRELMQDEKVAKWGEEREAEKNLTNAAAEVF